MSENASPSLKVGLRKNDPTRHLWHPRSPTLAKELPFRRQGIWIIQRAHADVAKLILDRFLIICRLQTSANIVPMQPCRPSIFITPRHQPFSSNFPFYRSDIPPPQPQSGGFGECKGGREMLTPYSRMKLPQSPQNSRQMTVPEPLSALCSLGWPDVRQKDPRGTLAVRP